MIEIVVGPLGSGKTLYTVVEAMLHRAQYPEGKIVMNFPTEIPGALYEPGGIFDMAELFGPEEVENSLWIIDGQRGMGPVGASEGVEEVGYPMLADAIIGLGGRIIVTTHNLKYLHGWVEERSGTIIAVAWRPFEEMHVTAMSLGSSGEVDVVVQKRLKGLSKYFNLFDTQFLRGGAR